jgi:SAM-dependent methyltransferase
MVKTGVLPYSPISELRWLVLKFFEKMGESVTGSILHVGSGPDTFNYRQYFPNAARYRCLNRWGGLGGGRFPNIDIHADVQDMPEVETNSEDVLIATFFLFQVQDVDAAMREMQRVLKPNGLIVFTFTGWGWQGNKHYHVWHKVEAVELAARFFTVLEVQDSDIGTFIVARNG